MHNYTPLAISVNEKNKTAKLLSQRKLAITGKNMVNGCVNSEGHPKK
jgi:hypothetical protein